MITMFDPFRDFHYTSVLLRLILALVFGGVIGLEAGRKGRPAGFRTYMLVCLGAALTMLLGQYELQMADGSFHSRFDPARYGAQVINGIGFLGAGTILVTGKQQIKGLTTAAGLWSSACAGLAIGAGFYECVLLALLLMLLVVKLLPYLEEAIVNNLPNMNIYVEYDRVEHTGAIIRKIRELDARIYEVDIDRRKEREDAPPSVVFNICLNKKTPHTQVLSYISQLEYISVIEEI